MKIKFPEITWHVSPKCQGQIVVVSYGDDHNGYFWRQIVDRSDQTVTYSVANSHSCGCNCDCDCFEPWNEEPKNLEFVNIDLVDIARMDGTWELHVALPPLGSLAAQHKYRGAVARFEGLGPNDPIEFICDGGVWNKMDN